MLLEVPIHRVTLSTKLINISKKGNWVTVDSEATKWTLSHHCILSQVLTNLLYTLEL